MAQASGLWASAFAGFGCEWGASGPTGSTSQARRLLKLTTLADFPSASWGW